jgi:hypothetical protein
MHLAYQHAHGRLRSNCDAHMDAGGGGNLPPGLNRLGRIAAVLERVDVTFGSARRLSAVQSTPAVRHRGRLAPAPSPCPRSTAAAEVHRRFALHGVDPQVSGYPLPPGPRPYRRQLGRRNARGRAPCHLLLPLAPLPVQSVEQHDVGSGQLIGLVQVLTSALYGDQDCRDGRSGPLRHS